MTARCPEQSSRDYESDFQRRCRAAERGKLLPRIAELLRGCPFFRNDIAADAAAYADGLLNRLAPPDDPDELLTALDAMLADPGRPTFAAAATAFEAAARAAPNRLKRTGSVRLHLYAALSGEPTSVKKVAAHAVELAYAGGLDAEAARQHAAAASVWLLAATGKAELPQTWTRRSALAFLAQANEGSGPGLVEHLLRSRPAIGHSVLIGPVPGPTQARHAHRAYPSGTPGLAPAAVVLTTVGNAGTAEGRRVASEFDGCLGQALPLCPVPDLGRVRHRMLVAFPYAASAIDTLLGPLAGRRYVQIPPTLIVGDIGTGKSAFAHMLAIELGLPTEVVPAASGTALGGSARQWSTGEPSLPLSLVRRHHHAGPAVILDALANAITGQAGPAIAVALQSFLDPGAARRFRDPYLEAPVDLSLVTWLATATDVVTIPRAVRERWHVVRFPQPRAADMPRLANALLRRTMVRQGLHEDWATPLDAVELAALGRRWTGGSLRRLERYVAAVLAARGVPCQRH